MRKANTNDMFNIVRLINDLNLKDDIFKAQKGEEDLEKVGFNIFFQIIAKATTKKAQDMIYKVLAEPYEMTAEEVGLLEIDKQFEYFFSCFNLTTLINFIKRAMPKA